ncbi:MAG TPA: hypothetical protein ENH62_09420 [Marinobacter sp.]|uniref:Uncharacterized protein n=1 Tax=marine sediment metagenome TaxID=412755 RepID=A0A0F9PAM9_9ZZZZ|nr:hypothetical protein [Marinobacter sp.]
MTVRKFSKEDEAFLQGMLVALAVVALHDEETIYREIVDLQGEADLVWVARKHSDMKLSGLSQYGYGKK